MEKSVDEEIIENLGHLGLTLYEAKVYTALALLGEASVGEIYPNADVPRSAAYGVLERLQDRGMVEISREKPIRYRAVRPDLALKKLERSFEDAKREAVSRLMDMYKATPQAKSEEAIWIVKGRNNIDDKIVELISKAKKRIVFGSTVDGILRFREGLRAARKRGVRIEFLIGQRGGTEEVNGLGELVFVPIEEHVMSQLDMSVLLVDERFGLVGTACERGAGRREETVFWSDNLAFVSFLNLSLGRFVQPRKER